MLLAFFFVDLWALLLNIRPLLGRYLLRTFIL